MKDLKEKIYRMERHMMEHPSDYQTAISLLINRSRQYDNEQKKRYIEEMKRVARIKKASRSVCLFCSSLLKTTSVQNESNRTHLTILAQEI